MGNVLNDNLSTMTNYGCIVLFHLNGNMKTILECLASLYSCNQEDTNQYTLAVTLFIIDVSTPRLCMLLDML